MCRFVAYMGDKRIILEELLKNPENSLIKQSHEARQTKQGINADGFGIAWYDFDISEEPGIFKSTQPAWNDINLKHISSKIKSQCFLGHIRASTVGDVNQNNCHPFSYKSFSMVHNGTIKNFLQIKRKIIDLLEDELFFSVKGCTDSEYLFFLIMHFYNKNQNLRQSVFKAFNWIEQVQDNANNSFFSRLNIVITNGDEILGTRYSTKGKNNLSFNYSIKKNDHDIKSLILSSEQLNSFQPTWCELKENHYIYFEKKSKSLIIEEIK